MKKSIYLYLGFVLVCSTSACDPHGWQDDPDLDNKLQTNIEQGLTSSLQFEGDSLEVFTLKERMAHYKVPGLSIAIVKNGAILWAKGYGIADTKTDSFVDEQTLFQAASISKPIAALAALKLVEEGKIDLDMDINQYLTSWKVPESKFTQSEKVTLRRLLTHTAGMTVHGFPGYAQTDTFPDDVAVLNGNGNTGRIFVDTIPGAINRYSGGGYTVIERVVEDLSGQDFTAYLKNNVLEPLDMNRSTYQQPLGDDWTNVSAAYNGKGERYPGGWHNYPEQAAAGLWTTPSDLAKYIIAIQETLQGNTNPVLSRSMIQQMLTPHLGGQGLGPAVRNSGDSLTFSHRGKNAGFTNNMTAWAYRDEGIIVMTSADQGKGLIQEIERAASEVMGWDLSPSRVETTIELSEEEMVNRVGTYELKARDFQVNLQLEDGRMVIIDPSSGDKYPLRALDELRVIDIVDGDIFTFEKHPDGSIASMTQGERYRFEKID